jgi:8-oxo-dGDP phosphatase
MPAGDVMNHLRDELSSAYPVRSSTVDFRSGRVIDVRTDQVAMPGGTTATRDVVVHPGAVGILALDLAGRVLLIQQYRHPVGRLLWEPPAGLMDEPGESPLAAAKRELFEEAHLQALRWDVLLDIYTSPGMSDEAVRLFLARDVSPAAGPRFVGEDEEANLPTRWVPLDEAVRAVQQGDLHNPLAVLGVLAASVAAREGFAGLRPADSPFPEASEFTGSHR